MVPLKDYEELRFKLKVLEAKRQEDRERYREHEKVKEEAEQFLTLRNKLQGKQEGEGEQVLGLMLIPKQTRLPSCKKIFVTPNGSSRKHHPIKKTWSYDSVKWLIH